MKSGWTIGKRLAAAFSAMALIALVMGAVGYYGAVKNRAVIEAVGEVRLPSVDSLLAIKEAAEAIRGSLRTLSIEGLSPEIRKRQYDNIQASRKDYETAWKIYEPLPQTPEEAETWRRFVPAWEAWQAENNRLLDLHRRFDRLGIQSPVELSRQLERFTKDHYLLVYRVRNLLDDKAAHFEGGDDHTACNAGKFLPSFRTENQALAAVIKTFEEPDRRFHEAVGKIKKLVQEGKQEEGQAVLRREMVPAMQAVFKQFDEMLAVANEAAAVKKEADDLALGEATRKQREAIALLDKLVEINREVAKSKSQEGLSQAGFLKGLMLVAALVGLAAAVALGLWMTRSITGALRRVIVGLSEGAEEVASAAGQVSGASQSLAEGSSEQAASIEETSSSLEEMSSMTRRNADNAKEANRLMGEARAVVSAANEQMGRLTESMGEITRASEETSKIIKTIDEIAFQTNLLALNAAVEAARAGEAGAGFAVVADEVRNLAMRAAEAARSTAVLIEGTVKKVKDGSELVGRAEEAFRQVAGSSSKAADLVAEIAAASDEQAQGIGQINTAVSELDKVTQQNAANAEESASAAEEMSAQAESMKQMVAELVALAGGKSGKKEAAAPGGKAKPRAAAVLARAAGRVKAKVGGRKKGASPAPETVIPLGENDLADF